jgi:arginine/lysine/ornithine decarboxylase
MNMDQTKMPLVEALKRHKKQNPVSFHVPGHKNGELSSFLDLSYDVTELNGLDDLHAPEGCIQEAENLLSDFYQTVESKFLINGSTVGNLAMILGSLSEGDHVFVQRNCHKSVLNALKMAKTTPVFLAPDYDENTRTVVLFSAETLKKAYRQYRDVKAVIFTYPSYYGMADSFETLAAIAKENGSLVLVDEAHGAHFVLPYKGIPDSALYLGADIVVQSAHKMLPAMTMGSYFHIQSNHIDRHKMMFYLHSLQSSSPSYPIMASLDAARAYTAAYEGCDVHYSMQVIDRVKTVLESKGCMCVKADDPYKILVRADGLSGYELQTLFERAGIYPEMPDPFQVLLIFPLLKEGQATFEAGALQKLHSFHLKKGAAKEHFPDFKKTAGVSILELPYNEHSKYKKEFVPFHEAASHIAGEMIIPYPPGIPLVMEGERISIEHIESLEWMLINGSRFHGGSGLKERQIAVFRGEV